MSLTSLLSSPWYDWIIGRCEYALKWPMPCSTSNSQEKMPLAVHMSQKHIRKCVLRIITQPGPPDTSQSHPRHKLPPVPKSSTRCQISFLVVWGWKDSPFSLVAKGWALRIYLPSPKNHRQSSTVVNNKGSEVRLVWVQIWALLLAYSITW
jgi:hypothetical protein